MRRMRAATHRLFPAEHLVSLEYVQSGGPQDRWPRDPKVTMTMPIESTVRARTAQPNEKRRISGHPPSAPDARAAMLSLRQMADTAFDVGEAAPLMVMTANEEIAAAQVLEFETALQVRGATTGWNAYEIWHGRIRRVPGATSLFMSRS